MPVPSPLCERKKNLRIALVHPPPYLLNMPPLGIAYLASALKKFGFTFKVFDLNADYYYEHPEKRHFLQYYNSHLWCNEREFKKAQPITDQIMAEWGNRIISFNPDVVGISVNDHSFLVSNMLSDHLKSLNPNLKIIYGGPFSTLPSLSLRKTTDSVDAYVIGEGEETFKEMLENLEKNGSFVPCRGVAIKKRGKVIFYGERQKLNIDTIPFPDFSEFPLDKYFLKTTIPILLSRGCDFHCTFCSDCNVWENNRMRHPRNIIEEMASENKKSGIKDFGCNDLIINSDLKKIEELAELILIKKINITFSGQGRVRNDMSPELLMKLRKAGMIRLYIGLESGSQKILNSMRKGITLSETELFLEKLKAAGIESYGLWMIGYPGETILDFWKTVFFIIKNMKQMSAVASVSTCNLHLESDLFLNKEKYGIKLNKGDIGDWYVGKLDAKERQRRERIFKGILHHFIPFEENKQIVQ